MRTSRPLAALALLIGACHGAGNSPRGERRYQDVVKRVVAWEQLEDKLFGEAPADRSDADLEAYLDGASGRPAPMNPAQRAQLITTFKNAPRAAKSEKARQDFEACQVAIENELAAWFDKWETEHRGVAPDCGIASASVAATHGCAAYGTTRDVLGEERQCACERAAVWKTLIEAADLGGMEGRAAAAAAHGVAFQCP